ncbi:unnamed protein product [Leuciscus chuanchicus]
MLSLSENPLADGSPRSLSFPLLPSWLSIIYASLVHWLAYQLAARFRCKCPASWKKKEMAGKDWLTAFLQHFPCPSAAPKPPACSAQPVSMRTMHYHCAGAGQSDSRHGGAAGRSNDFWGEGDIGHHRLHGKNSKEHFVRDGPAGSIGSANGSGWMQEAEFLLFLQDFASHTRVSKESMLLLLLDNHHSHINIDILEDAQEFSPEAVLPFPKAGPRKENKRGGRRRQDNCDSYGHPSQGGFREGTGAASSEEKRRRPKKQLFSIPATAAFATVAPASAPATANAGSQEEECVVCGEAFNSSMPGEVWVQCLFCLHWSHKACTDDLETLKSQGLHCEDVLGTVGPFKIFLGSLEALVGPSELPDEVMDALFYIISRSQPGTEPINSQAMRLILEGSSRARSTYFLKKNILKGASAVFGPYLVGECHWTLFHCNLKEGTITYIDSLGEHPQRCQRPWKFINRDHDLQNDSASCGVFSIMFAEIILQGQQGHLQCLPISQERERLGTLLFKSLDSSGICTVCYKKMSGKKKETCSFCSTEKSPKPEAETAEMETAEAVEDTSDAEEEEQEEASEKKDGFYVDSLLKVASSKKAKRHFVSVEELQRKCSAPEKFSGHLMVAYLRKAKGEKKGACEGIERGRGAAESVWLKHYNVHQTS